MITVSPKPAESTAPGLRNAAGQLWYGLTDLEAAERLRPDGFNELPSTKPRNLLQTIVAVLREPMLLLLVAAGIVYLLLAMPWKPRPWATRGLH